ncbi:MAG TPA: hypothetical protein VGX75_15905 [bacterium]|nr:hypothetical protein [bacterium]
MPGRTLVAAALAMLFGLPVISGGAGGPTPVLAQGTPPDAAPPASAPATPAAVPAAVRAADRFGVDLAWPANPIGARLQPSTVSTVGAGWVHLTVDWDALEPARGKFAWHLLDDAVQRAMGERVLVTIQRTPKWAALTPDAAAPVWSHEPPKSIADWSGFVRAIAGRYRGKVAAWQVEPPIEFATFRGTTRDYLDMLHAARTEIRQVDRSALVVASTSVGLDLPFMKLLFGRAGDDFDAVIVHPRGRTAADLLEALGTLRNRKIVDAHHEIWLSARTDWPQPVQLAATALAMGVTREFWQALTPQVVTVLHAVGDATFIGPLDRGPGVYAFVFADSQTRTAVLWTDGPARTVPIATTGAAVVTGADGQQIQVAEAGMVPVGPEPVFVTTPAASVLDEAAKGLAAEPVRVPRDPSRDFTNAAGVSATLGTTNVERGLYNQQLRTLPSGGVLPVTVDGADAVRTDQMKDAVYVYFTIDDSYAYFVDGRYDYLITVEVHRAGGPQRVGFNLMYDSMSGYRFSPWQWVDQGDGWAKYTTRISDASFSKTWGWDFAVNGAADKKENLVVRSVTVTRVPPGQAAP